MKSKAGRPAEGRVKVTWYVLPLTKTRIEYLVNAKTNTPGKVIDDLCGARGKSAGSARAGKQIKPRQHPNVRMSDGL